MGKGMSFPLLGSLGGPDTRGLSPVHVIGQSSEVMFMVTATWQPPVDHLASAGASTVGLFAAPAPARTRRLRE